MGEWGWFLSSFFFVPLIREYMEQLMDGFIRTTKPHANLEIPGECGNKPSGA